MSDENVARIHEFDTDTESEVAGGSKKESRGAKRNIRGILWFLVFCVVAISVVSLVLTGVVSPQNIFSKTEDQSDEQAVIPVVEYVEKAQFILLRNEFDALLGRLDEIEGGVGSVSTKVSLVEADVNQVREAQVGIRQRVKNVEERVVAMEEKISTMDRKIVVAKKKVSVIRKKVTFPFVLDGIGSWNGVSFVSVGSGGKYVMLEVGQRINGWLLTKLDIISGLAVFKHTSGHIHSSNV